MHSYAFYADFVCAPSYSEESVLSPFLTPAVLHYPVFFFCCFIYTVSHQQDCVVHYLQEIIMYATHKHMLKTVTVALLKMVLFSKNLPPSILKFQYHYSLLFYDSFCMLWGTPRKCLVLNFMWKSAVCGGMLKVTIETWYSGEFIFTDFNWNWEWYCIRFWPTWILH